RRRPHGPLLREPEILSPDRSGVAGRPGRGPPRGMRAPGARVFRRDAHDLRSAARRRRHRLPAPRVEGDRPHPLRGDDHLFAARVARGRARLGTGRRRRHRPQPDLHRRALPPRCRRRWKPHRLCRRVASQDGAPGDRGRAAGPRGLRPQDLARLVALAAMWGASYLFMRYAVPQFGPATLIELRVLIAGLTLIAWLAFMRRSVGWRAHWPAYLFVGAVGLALPFVLIAQALTTIDASTAAILNALS